MKRRSTVLASAFIAALIAGAAAQSRDGAIIRNSGSTNTVGYTIKVWSDGTTSSVRSGRNGDPLASPVSGRIDKALAQRFFDDLRASKRAGSSGGGSCMKSASFGSVTTVLYHGWTSADLECPGNPALGSDVHAIAQIEVGPTTVHRRPLLPNEPRRPETPAGQVSPSPDSAS